MRRAGAARPSRRGPYEAARADANVPARAVRELGVHTAQVRALDALRLDVRVADVVSDPALLAADFAVRCHFNSLRKARTFSTGRWNSQASARPRRGRPPVAARSRPRQAAAATGRPRWRRRWCRRPAATAWLSGQRGRPARFPVPRRGCSPSRSGRRGSAVRDRHRLDGRFPFPHLPPGPTACRSRPRVPGRREAARAAPADDVAVRVDGKGARSRPGHSGGRGRRGGARAAGARRRRADARDRRPAQTAASRSAASAPVATGPRNRRRRGLGAVRAIEAVGQHRRRRPSSWSSSPAACFAGRVVDDAGAALAGVPVRIESDRRAPGEDPLPTLVTPIMRAGSPRWSLPGGVPAVRASRPGHVLRRAPVVDARGTGAPVEVVLEVRGARVFGRVSIRAAARAAGARVRCVASAIEDLTVQTGPLPLAAEAAALPSGAGRALGTTRASVADRDGASRSTTLIPGRYGSRWPTAARAAAQRRVPVAPASAGTWSWPCARVPGHRARRRRERRPDRRRARGGRDGRASPASAGLFALTDAGGRFALALPAGAYRLRQRRRAGHRPGRPWTSPPGRRRPRCESS